MHAFKYHRPSQPSNDAVARSARSRDAQAPRRRAEPGRGDEAAARRRRRDLIDLGDDRRTSRGIKADGERGHDRRDDARTPKSPPRPRCSRRSRRSPQLAGVIGDRRCATWARIGGSLANNDPAADYPAAVLGLGATINTNKRKIAADEFFTGPVRDGARSPARSSPRCASRAQARRLREVHEPGVALRARRRVRGRRRGRRARGGHRRRRRACSALSRDGEGAGGELVAGRDRRRQGAGATG